MCVRACFFSVINAYCLNEYILKLQVCTSGSQSFFPGASYSTCVFIERIKNQPPPPTSTYFHPPIPTFTDFHLELQQPGLNELKSIKHWLIDWLIEICIRGLRRKRYSFMTVQFNGTRSTKRMNTTRKLLGFFKLGSFSLTHITLKDIQIKHGTMQ